MSSGPDDETRPPDTVDPDAGDAFRQVVGADGATPVPLRESDQHRGGTDGDGTAGGAGDPAPGGQDAAAPGRGDAATDRDAVAPHLRAAMRDIESSAAFRGIRAQSRFDDLAVVRPQEDGRYADTIRVRAVEDGAERGVALGLLDRPDTDSEAFADDVSGALTRWAAAGEASRVLTVHDWGSEPRPWLATEPVGPSLVEWDCPDVATRFECGLAVAEAVTDLHARGVVHAGVDPGNVVARVGTLSATPDPVLANVSLLSAFRTHFQPADYLDPRYAAPEYYDRSFGCIDQATDLYGLGAVLYRLFTGRPPFTGSYSEVRSGVLDGSPTPPTAHDASLPDPLDDILGKALAKQKLMRYESAAQLHTDLERVCERSGYRV